jgi:predicted DCC family thiol-disulfide oxidoreductase YuxK
VKSKKNIQELRQLKKIIFFDGVCNLCNATVIFVIKRDRRSQFLFCPLQSELAAAFFKDSDLPQTDSVLLVEQTSASEKSTAVLKIARELDGLWPLLYVFRFFPVSLRDFLYHRLARNRYKWFGKQTFCRVPSEKEKELFIS